MMLDSKTIETLSVNAVKDSIVMSEFLEQFIAENDKEPSWDGFVYIYNNRDKKKSDLKGRMPVQIKGKLCDDHTQIQISYSMQVADLRNYLWDNGCILFVVYIGNNGLTRKIYYVELTPVKLRKLLKEAGQHERKTVHLKEFPADNDKKATIFFNCLQNCQKQASFKEGNLFSLNELEEQGILENIVIPFAGVGITDPQMALIKNEIYIYAKIKGSSVLQPVDMIPENIHTQEKMDALITIEDRVFYTSYSIIKNAEGIAWRCGESFFVKFDESGQTVRIKYKNSDKIRVIAKDLDFMLSYFEKGYFKVDDVEIPFDYDGIDASSNFNIDEEKEVLSCAKDIVKVLDTLNCSEDINIGDMKREDWRNMDLLITAFVDKKPVTGLQEDIRSVVVCMSVGKLKFAVCLEECEKTGCYKIYDFFKMDIRVMFKNKDGKKFRNSQFYILHKEDFLALNNIDFDVLLPSFQKLEYNCETFNVANQFLLEMLKAYDAAEGIRKEKLLKTCKEFSEWISKMSGDEVDCQIRKLNVLQTAKRMRELNSDEIKILYEMVEDKDTREDSRVGAYLLLGQQQAAEIHFANLSRDERENFKKYPIYHFWNV